MTVTSGVSRITYNGNGVTVNFAVPFYFLEDDQIMVTKTVIATGVTTTLILNTDYTVTGAGNEAGGSITTTTPPATGEQITIIRNVPLTQETDYPPNDPFPEASHERALDKLTMIAQQINDLVTRSIALRPQDTSGVPPAAYDAKGNRITNMAAPTGDSDATTRQWVAQAITDAALSITLPPGGISEPLYGTGSVSTRALGDLQVTTIKIGDLQVTTAKIALLAVGTGQLANDGVDNTKLINMAAGTVKGRAIGAGTGDPTDLGIPTIGAGKQSIWIPAGAMIPRPTNGPSLGLIETATNRVVVRTLDFDPTTQEFAQFLCKAPKGWNEGTVSFFAIWLHAATVTNFGVVWSLQGLALSNDDALETAFGTPAGVLTVGGTTNDVYISAESGAITIGNSPAEGDLLIFQVSRDTANPSDTLAVDARLIGVMVLYTTNANTDD